MGATNEVIACVHILAPPSSHNDVGARGVTRGRTQKGCEIWPGLKTRTKSLERCQFFSSVWATQHVEADSGFHSDHGPSKAAKCYSQSILTNCL